jgi:hypothetical protein
MTAVSFFNLCRQIQLSSHLRLNVGLSRQKIRGQAKGRAVAQPPPQIRHWAYHNCNSTPFDATRSMSIGQKKLTSLFRNAKVLLRLLVLGLEARFLGGYELGFGIRGLRLVVGLLEG